MNIRAARHHLGLTLGEFAALHQSSTDAVRRWEKPQDASGYREPSGSAKALTEALLEGYRPKWWLTTTNTQEGE